MPFITALKTRAFVVVSALLVVVAVDLLAIEFAVRKRSPLQSPKSDTAVSPAKPATWRVTRNTRLSVIDHWYDHRSQLEFLILRESFSDVRQDSTNRPASFVTVEVFAGREVRSRFEEPGERGDLITGSIYKITKLGAANTPNTYTFFSLPAGHKLKTVHTDLTRSEIVALDSSLRE